MRERIRKNERRIRRRHGRGNERTWTHIRDNKVNRMVVVSAEEAEKRILDLLTERGEMSTQEIQEANKSEGVDCPDGAVKTLTKMRYRGLVMGRLSREKGGWVWWIPDSTGNDRAEG